LAISVLCQAKLSPMPLFLRISLLTTMSGWQNFIHHLVKVHWIFFQLCVQLPSPLHPVWLIAVK
ncbi:MAG: hypothetical protein J1F27_07835, partial [Prevotellaceae bacterium]|nr:hypothetical protein [Prevotellaceae bacterium]